MCDRYKEQSKEQLKKHIDIYNSIANKIHRDKQKDDAFARKLQGLDEHDSLDDELPRKKTKFIPK